MAGVKADLGILLFILISGLVISSLGVSFIEMISALYVLGGSLSFALSASGAWNSNDRLEAALEGAVICGWLGALIGAIAVARNSDSQWENLGPAVAVILLTVMYGYFVKVIVRLVLLGRSRQ